jgi:dethiobiotin synthetase
MAIYFISGIDTAAGKSIATGMLAKYLISTGKKVITRKLVQTGCSGISEDIETHRTIMGLPLLPEDISGLTCSYTFKFPASPHLAASLEYRTIDPEIISAATDRLAENYDIVLIEGAGGLSVPLTMNTLTIDYLEQKKYPLILVCSGRLGSVNHALLSLEAAQHRNIPVAGIVYNLFPAADPVISADTRELLRHYLKRFGYPESIIDLPEIPDLNNAGIIDFSTIFKGDGNE